MLPTIDLIEYRGRIGGGTSNPMVFVGSTNGATTQVVVKLQSQPHCMGVWFGPLSCAVEFLCAYLARKLGLDVPDFFVANLPRAVAQIVGDDDDRALLLQNLGENFACAKIDGCHQFVPARYASGFRDALEDILSFDAATVNPDRRHDNPNLLLAGDRLIAIDHGLALGMHLCIGEFSPTDGMLRDHAAFPALWKAGRSFARLYGLWDERLSDPSIIRALKAQLPPSWRGQGDELENIFLFLENRVQDLISLQTTLKKVVR